MKKLSNTEAELKKRVACKISQFANLKSIFSSTKYDHFLVFHYFEGVESAG